MRLAAPTQSPTPRGSVFSICRDGRLVAPSWLSSVIEALCPRFAGREAIPIDPTCQVYRVPMARCTSAGRPSNAGNSSSRKLLAKTRPVRPPRHRGSARSRIRTIEAALTIRPRPSTACRCGRTACRLPTTRATARSIKLPASPWCRDKVYLSSDGIHCSTDPLVRNPI